MRVEELQTDDHIWHVRELAIAHHEELGGSREFDSAAVVDSALVCREHDERANVNCWLVYSGDGKAIGYLAGTIKRNFYSYRNIATQEMWYVLPEYRGTHAALMLVKEFEEWARKHKCEQIYMGVEHNVADGMTQKITKLMERLGYHTRGTFNIKRIDA